MAITHLLLAHKTHEKGQNLKRERKIGDRIKANRQQVQYQQENSKPFL